MKSNREVLNDIVAKLRQDLENRRDKLERKQTDSETWMVRGETAYIRGKIDEIVAMLAKGEI